MRLLLLLACLLAATVSVPRDAEAQNFFERLFGIAPSRPEPPPVARPTIAPTEDQPKRAAPAAPVQARPVAVKAPAEEAMLGRELKQNGTNGSFKIERTARGDLRLKLTVVGRRSATSADTCTVAFGGPDGVPLVAQGRPEGAPRYQLQSPDCPLQVDVLDEAVLVKGPTEACVFASANCQADASGLWGPEPAGLLGRARDYESARASADKAVRDNYKVLAQRAGRENIRPIVAEQAAFSSDREMVCRTYAREGSHSFCNSRFTEARALALATRLGVTNVAANTQPGEQQPRIRRQRTEPPAQNNDLIGRPGLDPAPEE